MPKQYKDAIEVVTYYDLGKNGPYNGKAVYVNLGFMGLYNMSLNVFWILLILLFLHKSNLKKEAFALLYPMIISSVIVYFAAGKMDSSIQGINISDIYMVFILTLSIILLLLDFLKRYEPKTIYLIMALIFALPLLLVLSNKQYYSNLTLFVKFALLYGTVFMGFLSGFYIADRKNFDSSIMGNFINSLFYWIILLTCLFGCISLYIADMFKIVNMSSFSIIFDSFLLGFLTFIVFVPFIIMMVQTKLYRYRMRKISDFFENQCVVDDYEEEREKFKNQLESDRLGAKQNNNTAYYPGDYDNGER